MNNNSIDILIDLLKRPGDHVEYKDEFINLCFGHLSFPPVSFSFSSEIPPSRACARARAPRRARSRAGGVWGGDFRNEPSQSFSMVYDTYLRNLRTTFASTISMACEVTSATFAGYPGHLTTRSPFKLACALHTSVTIIPLSSHSFTSAFAVGLV